MSSIESIKCRHCNSEVNKKKQEYYREEKVEYIEEVDDVKITHPFKLKWYYCNKCKGYFSFYGDKEMYSIKYDDDSEEFFKNELYEDVKRYRKIILKNLLHRIEEDIEYSHSDDTYKNDFYFGKGMASLTKTNYKNYTFDYQVKYEDNYDCIVSIRRFYSKGYQKRYDRFNEDLKKIEYNFDELDENRKKSSYRYSWKSIADRLDMTEPELKLILKNKTRRKLDKQELRILMTFTKTYKIGGYTNIDLDRPW